MNNRLIRNGTIVNVYSGELLPGNVAIADGRITYVGPGEPAASEVLDARGLYLAPAWIEPHAHPWLLYNPVSMIEAVLPGGTTTIFNDDLFFFLQAGPDGFARMLDALARLPIRYRWLVRLMSQSEYDGEARDFAMEKLAPLLARPEVAGSAELTRWPLVWKRDRCALDAIAHVHALGKRVDGHTAGASYEKLNGVAFGGVDACHEAITKQEVLDRLRLGIWTILRHSSLRPDIPELARSITEDNIDTRRVMLTVDGPAPRSIAEGGFIDEALQQCVAAGVDPVEAIQMATINPATYYGLDRELGGIAPGRKADLVMLPDLCEFRPVRVMMEGRDVAIEGKATVELPRVDWDGLGLRRKFQASELPLEVREPIPVIEFVSDAITRSAGTQVEPAEGDILGVLADREGRWATRAWIRNMAPRLDGLASSYNTAMHLLVLGRDPAAMRRAAEKVAASDGGIGFGDGWSVALPVAGMMMDAPFAECVRTQQELERRIRAAGYPFRDILYSLLFLCCDFLPGLRLTPRGVLDVRSGNVVAKSNRENGA
jgi:adenine deaminase